MNAFCHACGADFEVLERVGRRDCCDTCGADLRCCRNCELFAATAHNQCREPQAERQVDKERANFCDYFAARRRRGEPASSAAATTALEALFAGRRK